MQHIKIPDTFQIFVYWELMAYSEYHESLEYSFTQNSQLSATLPFKN